MARIVTVGSTKGGVGKTTISINLAISRALAGRDVWLVNADRQETASIALTIRAEAGRQPTVATAQYVDGASLRAQVQHQRNKFDEIIIDAGGRDSTSLRAALLLTDVLLVPFQPRSLDVWAVSDIAALVEEANAIRLEPVVAYAFLNLADPAGLDNREAADAIAAFPQFRLLNAPIKRRKSIANAAGLGQSVLEYSPRDEKAVSEINELLEAIY